jgi:DNA-binding PadR family transcriptional regulator
MAQSQSESYPLSDLRGFQRDALRCIEKLDKPHGLAVKNELEAARDMDEVHHGRLYPNLDELVDKGLVGKGMKDRRTNVYTMTRRGTRELDAHRAWLNGEE